MNTSTFKDQINHQGFALAIIGISVFTFYSNIYNSPFTFDDIPRIVENTSIRDLSNYFSFKRLFEPRAIVEFTFALNYRFGKLDVSGYHLFNILIHILNGFLVYFLSLVIFNHISVNSTDSNDLLHQRIMALFSALLFVVHPIQTQAVTYTVQRATSMAAVFYLSAIFFYLKARIIYNDSTIRDWGAESENKAEERDDRVQTGKCIGLYITAIMCGMLGFLSKQNTASLPGTILLMEIMLFKGGWQDWKRKILWFVLLFIGWLLFILYATGQLSGDITAGDLLEDVSRHTVETGTISRWRYLCTQFNVLVIYIRLLFLPCNQNLDYLYPFKSGFFDDLTPLAFIFLILIAGIGIWNIKRHSVVTLSIFFFFITLSVESSIIPIRDAIFEHRLYLPMFGFGLLVSYLPFYYLPSQKTLAVLILTIIVAIFGTATYARNKTWQSETALWMDVFSKSPHNPRAGTRLGIALEKQHRTEDAIDYYLQVLRVRPDFVDAHVNLGLSLEKQNRLDEAIDHYQYALEKKPDYAEAHNNMGNALNKMDRLQEAVDHYQKALRLNPNYAEAHTNLGATLDRLGRTEDAIVQHLQALEINPDFEKAYYNLGIAFDRLGQTEKSISYFSKALKLNPDYLKARNNLGLVLLHQKRTEEAIDHFRQVLQKKPDDANVHYNLGLALYDHGHTDEAIDYLKQALQIQPDCYAAYIKLGIILDQLGRNDEAVNNFRQALEIKPDSVEAYYNLGLSFDRQNRIEEAAHYYRQALKIKPDYMLAYNNLGVALFRQGDIDEAIASFQNALRINPNDVNAKDNLEKILMMQNKR